MAIKARLVPSGASIIVKNTIQDSLARRLDGMVDVTPDNGNTVTGSTLVYDSGTDKYIVKLLDLDGGSF